MKQLVFNSRETAEDVYNKCSTMPGGRNHLDFIVIENGKTKPLNTGIDLSDEAIIQLQKDEKLMKPIIKGAVMEPFQPQSEPEKTDFVWFYGWQRKQDS